VPLSVNSPGSYVAIACDAGCLLADLRPDVRRKRDVAMMLPEKCLYPSYRDELFGIGIGKRAKQDGVSRR